MTLQTITSTLQTGLQAGQIVLTNSGIDGFDLTGLLAVLNIPQLTLTEATLTSLDNSVTLSGKAVILGTAPIGLDLTFTTNGDAAVDLAFTATAPTGQIPGVSWSPPVARLRLTPTSMKAIPQFGCSILPSN
jgi:hypothetical protein